MEISASQVKELREKTGVGIMECKKALTDAGGDFQKAVDLLRKKGFENAAKKTHRATDQGAVISYIHGEGKVGVLLEMNCETDFVARTDQFRTLAKDIAMHIAAVKPLYVSSAEVSAEVIAKEKEIVAAQVGNQGKPPQILEKIIEGKIKKFYEDFCLLNQVFVKDSSKTIEVLLKEAVMTLGENLTIRRFARFALGEHQKEVESA